MLMGTTLLEGTDGLGEFDFVYFAGPGDFALRLVNEKRRADPKLGAPAQIPVLFDGRGVNPTDQEAGVSEGYVGKCAM